MYCLFTFSFISLLMMKSNCSTRKYLYPSRLTSLMRFPSGNSVPSVQTIFSLFKTSTAHFLRPNIYLYTYIYIYIYKFTSECQSDYPIPGVEIARTRRRFQHPLLTSKPATMTKCSNHHLTLSTLRPKGI